MSWILKLKSSSIIWKTYRYPDPKEKNFRSKKRVPVPTLPICFQENVLLQTAGSGPVGKNNAYPDLYKTCRNVPVTVPVPTHLVYWPGKDLIILDKNPLVKKRFRYLETDEAELVGGRLVELLAEGEDEALPLVPGHQGQHAHNAVQDPLHLHQWSNLCSWVPVPFIWKYHGIHSIL